MSRDEGKVVTKECLVTKPNERKSSAWLLSGPAGVSAERIQMDDLYKAYQGMSW